MDSFEYIIAGGGLAGLSLAFKLKEAGIAGSSVLMVDRVRKQENDRTWCFWSKAGHPFESIVSKSWNQVMVRNGDLAASQSTGAWPYHLVFSESYYQMVWESLDQWAGFTFLQADVQSVQTNENFGLVETSQGAFKAAWVFDSRFRSEQFQDIQEPLFFQHFKGQFIRTEEPVFDPGRAILMDFQDSNEPCAFFYVLPLSSQEALVEYTVFSEDQLNRIQLERKLQAYLDKRYQVRKFEILRKEKGTLPMTTGLKIQDSKRHIQIGLAGNGAKPSSGYAFTRIQEQTDRIVQQIQHGIEPRLTQSRNRFSFYDRLLLKVLQDRLAHGNDLMWSLLSKNKPETVFQFLSEQTTVAAEAKLFWSLPWAPFLKALLHSRQSWNIPPVENSKPPSIVKPNG